MRLSLALSVLVASSVARADDWHIAGDRVPRDAVNDAAVAERVARVYIDQHVGRLAPGAASLDFRRVANHVDRGIRTITFQQTAFGLPVLHAAIGIVIKGERIVAVHSTAKANVAARLRRVADGDAIVGDRVARVRVEPEARVYRDVLTGEELAREPTVMHASGTLLYNAGLRHGDGERTDFVAPFASIIVDSAGATTDANGTFAWATSANASVTTSITGTYVAVHNSGGVAATATLDVAPGGTAAWNASIDEATDAQVSTYIYGNLAKARARIVNPAVSTWLDAQLDFFVNETGVCNAYATANAVHLFQGNSVCENTGRIADIVFHEFGHSLHANSLIPGMGAFESALSEGLSDFFAANLTGDPGVARGFYHSDDPLRDIDPPGYERVYPADDDFDPHIAGLIIAGALWDLRKAIGVAPTERVYTGVMQRAADIPSSYMAARIADDDDDDLSNGTPHGCALERAFGRHGLVDGYVDTTIDPPVVTDRSIALHVTTPTAGACPALTVSAMTVSWSGGTDFSLTASGDTWSGEFPAVPDGTAVTYAITVTYDDGSTTHLPNNEADPRYQLYVGPTQPIWCESFDTDPMWPHTTDWQWGAPAGNLPDPASAYTGETVLGTNLLGPYAPDASMQIMTPVIDVSGFEDVRLQYWRWLTVEDATYDQATIRANGTEVWRNAISPPGTLDHVDREWRFHDLDVTPAVSGSTLQLAWTLDSDVSKQLGGWTIDDVCVVGVGPAPACDDCNDDLHAGGGGCSTSDPTGGWLLAAAIAFIARRRPWCYFCTTDEDHGVPEASSRAQGSDRTRGEEDRSNAARIHGRSARTTDSS